ncbi:MAG TPA: amidase, partial [Thermomicrobiales bacterium]|nr:amidase [Thermomicrobiales bacterium]
PELAEATIAELQRRLAAGELTAAALAGQFVERIEAVNQRGPAIRAVLELNPDAPAIAAARDRERATGRSRGPLHGIPVLLKDNVATADRMETAAGSLALLGARPRQDAHVARRLRDAGAVILGKTNLSEWSNFRSLRSSGGWSGRGGQTLNPYALDATPCGSSSGSGAAIAAGLAAAAVGTDTDGSIVCPAASNAIVGLRPTVGVTSRAGVIPIAHSQDTVGPMTRTVADAAVFLSALAGPDPADPATAGAPSVDYTAFLDRDGLRGARIGVPRDVYWGYSPPADAIAAEAVALMRDLGAEVIDPADIPTAHDLSRGWPPSDDSALTVLLYECKADLNAYLAGLGEGTEMRSLADLIAFNDAHAAEEMPYFGQELFIKAQAMGPLTDAAYRTALARNHRLSREEGIDAALRAHRLDALALPTTNPPTKIDLVNGSWSLGSSSR